MELFYQKEIEQGYLWLHEEESRHAVKVLRHKSGDQIKLTNGQGSIYTASITKANHSKCEFVITGKEVFNPAAYYIHIAIAPTKNTERMEWFIEKVTELGTQKITLLSTQHTEKRKFKTERLEKKAIAAMKQSGQYFLPEIQISTDFKKFIRESIAAEKFIAVVDHENPKHLLHTASKLKNYLVLIGPEGDFSTEELKLALAAGFTKVSLGNTRLRTETAGIAACHILNLINA